MKVVSFNVNSIRIRLHQLAAVIDRYAPDIIGLQETKVSDEEFPEEDIKALGYQVAFHGQKANYGVALLSRTDPASVVLGFDSSAEDYQRRFISGTFETKDGRHFTVINGYFPQGENRKHPKKFPAKEQFYADVYSHLKENHAPDDLVCVIGDMNVAPEDADIGIGEDNRKRWLREGKTCFLPEEREWLSKLSDWGLHDVYRHHNPAGDEMYSWFDYRSKGFERDPKRGLRIDLILGTQGAIEHSRGAGIDYDIRAMERPSDHCPVWAEFDL